MGWARGAAASPPPAFWGSLHTAQPGPLGGAGSSPREPGHLALQGLWGRPAGHPHLPGRGCGHLREPRPGGVSHAPPPWVGSPGSPRNEVTLLVHRTPIRIWVQKAVDRLEPGKETWRSGLLGWRCFGGLVPEPLRTAHSPCGVLLQTEASHHIHDIMWVFWTPVTQGDLGEGRGQVTLPGPAPPHTLRWLLKSSQERLLCLPLPRPPRVGPPLRADSGTAWKG